MSNADLCENQSPLELMKHSEKLCLELQTCLRDERTALIEFRMEDLLENNIRKENLLSGLLKSKKTLEMALDKQFGTNSLRSIGELLSGDERTSWDDSVDSWKREWDLTREKCRSNQKFLQHSLRNLNMFAEHFRRLLGVNSVYSKEGKEVEIQTEGNVLEAEY